MMKQLEPYAHALLRIVAGFMFAFHGAQLLFGVYNDFKAPVGTQMWFGGLIELVCGALVGVGYATRLAAFLCSGTMAVAYFQFHWKFQLDRHWLPPLNQGEMSVLYCFIFLLIACRGAGKWSGE